MGLMELIIKISERLILILIILRLLITCSIHRISTKVFIETLRINFLTVSHMNKRYSSADLRVQLLGISKSGLLLLFLEPVERFSLRFLAENYVPIEIRHLRSLTLQLRLYLILTHSLRGMKLTFNLPAIDG